jgi:hypothetical protein|nr:MAG TPA: hypothetical protein [Caudoviricetes sp.]
MMYAEKDNKVYLIDEIEMKYYLDRGFDIFDESGEVIEHGKGNEQAIAAELKAENEKLKAENEELKKAIETSEDGTAEAPEEGKNTSKK